MNKNIFRAYDIRGIYPADLDQETARLIAKGYISYLIRKHGLQSPEIVVGKDNRPHGIELQDAFVSGLLEHGAQVSKVEDCTSPMLYFAVCDGGFDGGVSITASHNPGEYNGFKLLGKMAHSIAGDEIQEILKLIQNEDFESTSEGSIQEISIEEAYTDKISSLVQPKRSLRVVVDAGNGIAGKYYPNVLRRMGCEVMELYCEQDGSFPNHEPDPVVEANTEDLKKAVQDHQANLGIAFDGDGDRCAIIDEKGQYYDANETFVLLIRDILSRHAGSSVIYTVSNSLIIPDEIRKHGGVPKMVPVGHSFVEQAMTKTGALLGGEQSGHFFIAEDYFGFDDACYTAARLIEIIAGSETTTSSLYSTIPRTFSYPEFRLDCPDDQKFEIVRRITEELQKNHPCVTIDGVRAEFEDGAWLGIRASNTAPKLSVLMEAKTENELEKIKKTATALLAVEGIVMN